MWQQCTKSICTSLHHQYQAAVGFFCRKVEAAKPSAWGNGKELIHGIKMAYPFVLGPAHQTGVAGERCPLAQKWFMPPAFV